MALLTVRHYPDPVLLQKAEPVTSLDQVRQLIPDMLETMVTSNGVGLAAPQVGVSLRLFVLDIWWPETKNLDKAMVFINPVIGQKEGSQSGIEGCLSLPGVQNEIARAEKIQVSFLDGKWKRRGLITEGFLAVAIQHEHDHLDGLLMLDRMTPEEAEAAKQTLLR